MMRSRSTLGLVAAVVGVGVLSACAPTPMGEAMTTDVPVVSTSASTTISIDERSIVALHAGEQWFLGEMPGSAVAADPSLPPIRIGMVNQENTPVGSYPELRVAVEAAVEWVNAELGGVGGHPIELLTCATPFDPEVSRQCALDLVAAGVVAFVGGVDVMSAAAIEVIEANDLVLIGGIPATLEEQRSANAFFFSGGDAGALAAFMAHAADTGATTVGIAYGQEVESFAVAASDYGATVARSLDLAVELIPYSIFTTDFVPMMTSAQAAGIDALAVLAATSACVPVMAAAAAELADAQLYLTGACAADTITDAAGDDALGVLFNAEGRVDGIDVDASIFQDVIDRYANQPAGGAGTVSFRGFMNLYALLLEAGPTATPGVLASLAESAVDRPSFWGHPYTCDGRQVPGLRALCAPQQALFRLAAGGGIEGITDWIATDELFAASGS